MVLDFLKNMLVKIKHIKKQVGFAIFPEFIITGYVLIT
jgi:hypothetical protein